MRSALGRYIPQHSFVVSQFIVGPDSNLYTYGSYAANGKVILDFIGRKLIQRPSVLGCVGLQKRLVGLMKLRVKRNLFCKRLAFRTSAKWNTRKTKEMDSTI
jgi:predicted ATP-grasp superfamily ATP-dependent carboligase